MEEQLCYYGCGKPAIIKFRSGRFCCSFKYQQCAEAAKRNTVKPETLARWKETYRGSNNPFYGKKHKPETNEKQRIRMLGKFAGEKNPIFGKPRSEETRLKISKKRISEKIAVGEKNPNWKGGKGLRPFKSFAYKDWRKQVFQRDNFTCQNCGKRGGDIQAHHLIRWADNENLRFEVSNGQTLCIPCHRKTYIRKDTSV